MVNHTIRPLAICLFQNSGAILVSEGYDGVKGIHFYRPIGGGIEFGETSSAALVGAISYDRIMKSRATKRETQYFVVRGGENFHTAARHWGLSIATSIRIRIKG